ncbi:F0F1 ATP synthase subunit delta [Pseudomethylobacillus aquaticus]|uniref:ATP synthase subunit delta n=1 Tax=Pseudomethylobacillus aquaticus TaxID=2676064 RepID=A0A3N0V2S8_9PROT|nr:F0F1 ATP synthase subunit delta [Pseudomethylobacillus aquaticus]ROH86841.1 F0F1 ATP synthase subunit delta [Pseudomethylobacillus aquaticus]
MAEAITIVRPYAVAAYRLAKEHNALSRWSEMLTFAAAVANDAQMRALIEDPKTSSAELERVFLAVCADRLDEPGKNLIRLLVEYDRLDLLPEVAAAYEALKAQDEGVLDAVITAAVKPSAAEIKAVVAQLERKFGKKVEASVKLAPEIIGGLKIELGDTVIDASVQGQLQELAYTLKG